MPTSIFNNPVGEVLIELDTVDSTNNYAMEQLDHGTVQNGTVILAHHQHAGKGQRGKIWLTEPHTNLAMSVVLEMNFLKPDEQFFLNAAVTLAVRDTVATLLPEKTVYIKWSNDIYINDCKVTGILIENSLRGTQWQHAVVGIGMNVLQTGFDPALPNPTSLKLEGLTIAPTEVCYKICANLNIWLNQLRLKSFYPLLKAYKSHLYLLNQPATFFQNEVPFEGTIRDVQTDGGLVMDTPEGRKTFFFGEIKFAVATN